MRSEKRRCNFYVDGKPYKVTEKLLIYHDTRWGKPLHDDNELFAMLILEGMQAGVSWNLILEKEDNFRKDFDNFIPEIVAEYDDAKIDELMKDPGIIRNKNKIKSAVTNAKAFLKIQQEFGSFDSYIWGFTDGKVIDHHLKDQSEMPAKDELSEEVSKDLKKRGLKYVGPVIIYSYLQGIGVINDHCEYCDYR